MQIESINLSALPDSPAATAAREEHAAIMNDPTHPMHAAFLRNDPTVNAHIDRLYDRLTPTTPRAPESIAVTTDSSVDTEAQASIEIALRNELGFEYDSVMEGMRSGAAYLFGDTEGQSALTVLSDKITALGPKAEALGIKFLSDLSKL